MLPDVDDSDDCRDSGDPIQSISAVTLVTGDMARAVSFYQALGFRLLHGGPESEFSTFRAGGGFVNLQLDEGDDPPVAGWGRVILWVNSVDAMYERALAAGLRPSTTPADASWGERYFHIRDPDGHELSFARPLGS
jgi:catechol 2,3-dioxygenase-like lactoylglutathione lyase family enzyme